MDRSFMRELSPASSNRLREIERAINADSLRAKLRQQDTKRGAVVLGIFSVLAIVVIVCVSRLHQNTESSNAVLEVTVKSDLPLPPGDIGCWALDGSKVVGPHGKKGIISLKVVWDDDTHSSPIASWKGISQAASEKVVQEYESREEREHEERKKEQDKTSEEVATPEEGLVPTHEYSLADVQVSAMLMGSVSFVMCLFHLVRYEDDDIRRYSWQAISEIVSIFVAVLIFNCANSWVLEMVKKHGDLDPVLLCGIQYIHTFLWICLCQLVLAFISGTICEGSKHNLEQKVWVKTAYIRADFGDFVDEGAVCRIQGTRATTYANGMAVPCELRKAHHERRERIMKCWGVLFAHIAGFAAINAAGTMQHLHMFSRNPWIAIVPILINQGFIMILFAAFNLIRERLEAEAIRQGRHGLRAKMFDAEVQESENDISALSWSFLVVQIVKFVLVGEMPSLYGDITLQPDLQTIGILYAVGLVFAVLSIICIKIRESLGLDEEKNDSFKERFLNITIIGFSLSFAWCFLFGSHWLFGYQKVFEEYHVGIETVLGKILLALLVSIFALIVLFFLDTVNDTFGRYSTTAPMVIEQTVLALSILAGLSWEHAFDGGVEALAAEARYPLCAATGLAAFVLVIIVPAWASHILQRAMDLKAYGKALKEAEAAAFDGGNQYSSVPFAGESSCTVDAR